MDSDDVNVCIWGESVDAEDEAYFQKRPDFLFNGCLSLWALLRQIRVRHDTQLDH